MPPAYACTNGALYFCLCSNRFLPAEQRIAKSPEHLVLGLFA